MAEMRFVLSLMLYVTICIHGVSCAAHSLNMSPSLPIATYDEYLTLRDDETGLLTGNELLSVFYGACGAVRGVVGLLNNPVFSVLGISGTVMHIPLPIPASIANPLGIPGFFQGLFLSLQDSINSIGKRKRSIPDERLASFLQTTIDELEKRTALAERLDERQTEESLTVGNVVEALDYPCQALDVFSSFMNNSSYVGWLGLGNWPLPLRDPLHKLNLLGIPGKIFSSIFGR